MSHQIIFPKDLTGKLYDVYKELRELQTPYFYENYTSNKNIPGVWLIACYDMCVEVSKNTKTIIKTNTLDPAKANILDEFMLSTDGLKHKRLRALISKQFSYRSTTEHETMITNTVQSYINNINSRTGEEIDFVQEFAGSLPLEIIADVIGFRKNKLTEIRRASLIICDFLDSFVANTYSDEQHLSALNTFVEIINKEITYIKNQVTSNKTICKSDMSISQGLVLDFFDNTISDTELTAMFMFLMFAGHETTTNLLSSALYLLLKHPEQLNLLINQPDLIPSCVEEVLRFESPEQRGTFRMTTEELVINDVTIPKDSQISVLLGSANRDEKVFTSADVFDITRHPNRHIAFGYGAHNCLGQHLSRLELQVFLREIMPLLPNIQLACEPHWRQDTFFRGLSALPIIIS